MVGGWVRDRLLGVPAGDVDLEVHGLSVADLEAALSRLGSVAHIGRAFAVLRIKGIDVDIAWPRDAEPAPVSGEAPALAHAFERASRRRDLTMDSMGWDPLSGALYDPHGGRADLERGVLRATDARRFGDDPVRALRVARFTARFDMRADDELRALCAAQALDSAVESVPGERIFDELRKLLLAPAPPSRAFEFMRAQGLLRFMPELAVLVGVPQDPEWHPEGDVFTHTLLVVDEAASLRRGDASRDLKLMLGALCHDLGKPETTSRDDDGRVRSRGHERLGAARARGFLERLRASGAVVAAVEALVRDHLAPTNFEKGGARDAAYRRLARRLEECGADLELLLDVATADHLGRTTADARARRFAAGEAFRARIDAMQIRERGVAPAVLGRHVLARGIARGPEVGRILRRCLEIQDETGWSDPDRLLDRALGTRGRQ